MLLHVPRAPRQGRNSLPGPNAVADVELALASVTCNSHTVGAADCSAGNVLGTPTPGMFPFKVKAGRKAHSESVTVGIPSGVNVAVEVHSWNRFYHDYVVDSGIAAFNFLPKFYTGDSSVHLCEALQAVTVASAAQQLQQSGLMVRARSHYGKAIMKLNTALDNKKSNADDSVLITLFLLSLFEVLTYR
ncbi:unnamed protein product, partial [Clonostachys rosea f. rosea IK726]